MPKKSRPATSGYARLAQADEERGTSHGYSDVSDDDDAAFNARTLSPSRPQFAPIQPNAPSQMQLSASASQSPSNYRRKSGGPRRRHRSNSSGVDIKAINARLERWAEDITSKFKIHKVKGKTTEEEQLEIHHSVFQAPDGMRPLTMEELSYDEGAGGRMTKMQFDDIVESVRIAIEQGVHPKMISQGSSGSYFARNTEGKVVGVFKPKDEEPYASRNPKWTKWIHRNLFPCFFGRACLIPNLSYVSEAAAYVLDARLKTNLVPYTDIVWLSSKSFFYDFWDRRSYWRGKKPLPAKVGSFQVFLKGFKDANIFLRENPWPDQVSTFRPSTTPRRRQKPWSEACQPSGVESDDEADENEPDIPSPIAEEPEQEEQAQAEETPKVFRWTETLKQSFREELEKLVILDYIMRNTDRGLDNWMVKVDWETEEVSIVSEPIKMNGNSPSYFGQEEETETRAPRPVNLTDTYPYRRQEGMFAVSRTGTPSNMNGKAKQPTMSLGAIDNSLSWPWKHPDAWRSFPFGWLFLPVSLIGQPFSKKTRDHFLPLLTSTIWWSDTQMALRRVFSQDSDFKESMFARQIAVMKGQAWNVVETLKTPDHGPLELTRRTRVCVWDDLVDVPVAIPLRVPSTEMQRRRLRDYSDDVAEEEMDISAAVDNPNANNSQNDLLGMGSPTSELPNPNRFELSRDPSIFSGDEGGSTINGKTAKQSLSSSLTLPPRQTSQARSGSRTRAVPGRNHSFDIPRRTSNFPRRGSNVSFLGIYGGSGAANDDLEGDLGYAAAEGMEGQERKVIVERLETVKARNPVFTWC